MVTVPNTEATPSSRSDRTDPERELLAGIECADPSLRDAVSASNYTVRAAAEGLRVAIDGLHQSQDEAWRAYADEIDRALVRLDIELQIAAARLRAERAASREELTEALHSVADIWQSRVDDVRVQARLAQMEGRDAYRHSLADLTAAREQVELALRELGHDLGSSLAEARDGTLDAIGRVARAFGALRTGGT